MPPPGSHNRQGQEGQSGGLGGFQIRIRFSAPLASSTEQKHSPAEHGQQEGIIDHRLQISTANRATWPKSCRGLQAHNQAIKHIPARPRWLLPGRITGSCPFTQKPTGNSIVAASVVVRVPLGKPHGALIVILTMALAREKVRIALAGSAMLVGPSRQDCRNARMSAAASDHRVTLDSMGTDARLRPAVPDA